jgi:hypothetical protein
VLAVVQVRCSAFCAAHCLHCCSSSVCAIITLSLAVAEPPTLTCAAL